MAIRNDFAPGEVLAAADLNDTFGSKLSIAGGKVLQIVRATDNTNRSTTSTSFVDASISVTITPQKSDSAILLIWTAVFSSNNLSTAFLQISDNSNNAVSGAESGPFVSVGAGFAGHISLVGYSSPATTSATTYKGRFRNAEGDTVTIDNGGKTGQMYAIEVSA
jgi:hypothetical protein